jgi:hypothetical protein
MRVLEIHLGSDDFSARNSKDSGGTEEMLQVLLPALV